MRFYNHRHRHHCGIDLRRQESWAMKARIDSTSRIACGDQMIAVTSRVVA
jgi:hypothetical protein